MYCISLPENPTIELVVTNDPVENDTDGEKESLI
jgi:hypothetical protein